LSDFVALGAGEGQVGFQPGDPIAVTLLGDLGVAQSPAQVVTVGPGAR